MADGFRLEEKQYNLNFEDPALNGMRVSLTGMNMQQLLDFDVMRFAPWAGVEDNAKRTGATAEIIAAHLVAWNLVEKDRTATPLTADGLLSHDPAVQRAIMDAYVQALRGVPAPLDDASTTGEEVESLPTETLQPNP